GVVPPRRGRGSHRIVLDADQVMRHMDHRGACGCEESTGDGAGILTALPYEFLAKVARDDLKADLPPAGQYGAGLVFLPQAADERAKCKHLVQRIIREEGPRLVRWRR